jgi:cell division protein FtsB
MKKNDIYFTLLLLFIVKLIVLPAGFADAAVLLVLLIPRSISNFIKLQQRQKISQENEVKFAEVADSMANMQKTIESIKIQEQVKQQFGMRK